MVDSIYIHAVEFDELGLHILFSNVLDGFEYYDSTEVDKEQEVRVEEYSKKNEDWQ